MKLQKLTFIVIDLFLWLILTGPPTPNLQCHIITMSLLGQMNAPCTSPTSRAATAATTALSQRNMFSPTGHECLTFTSISQTGDQLLSQRTTHSPEVHPVQTLDQYASSKSYVRLFGICFVPLRINVVNLKTFKEVKVNDNAHCFLKCQGLFYITSNKLLLFGKNIFL